MTNQTPDEREPKNVYGDNAATYCNRLMEQCEALRAQLAEKDATIQQWDTTATHLLQRAEAAEAQLEQARAVLREAARYHFDDADAWGPTPDGYFKVADLAALIQPERTK